MTKNTEAKPLNPADQKQAPMAAKIESVEAKPAAAFPAAAVIAQPAIVKKPVVRAAKKAPAIVAEKAPAKAEKSAAKLAAKPAASKTVSKVPVKAAPKAAAIPAPAKKQVIVKPAADTKEKAKKPKLVRDSFTMPEIEYAVLGQVKKTCLKAGIEVKKSELLRAGVALIEGLDIEQLKMVLASLTPLKAGRPKKDK